MIARRRLFPVLCLPAAVAAWAVAMLIPYLAHGVSSHDQPRALGIPKSDSLASAR